VALVLWNDNIPNLWEYDEIAKNLVAGAGFTGTYFGIKYHSLVMPVYPLLTAAVYKISNNNYSAMLFVQIVLSSLIPVLIFKIAQLIYDKKIAILAAILAIFHPGLIVFSSTMLHALTLDALMFSIVVMFFLIIKKSPTLTNQVLLGLFSGLCVLTRPTVLIFILLAFIWLYFILNIKYLKKIKCLIIISLIILAIISPWLIRNYLIHKQIVFQTTTGFLFWIGNNEKAVGTATLPNGTAIQNMMPPDFAEKIYSMNNEIEQNNAFFDEAFKFIKKYPFSFIKLFFKKQFYFWWFSPSTGINYPPSWATLYKIYYSLLFLSLFMGIYLTLRKSKSILKENILTLPLLFISVSMCQSLFYVEGRHRWEIEALFIIPASYAIFYLLKIIKKAEYI